MSSQSCTRSALISGSVGYLVSCVCLPLSGSDGETDGEQNVQSARRLLCLHPPVSRYLGNHVLPESRLQLQLPLLAGARRLLRAVVAFELARGRAARGRRRREDRGPVAGVAAARLQARAGGLREEKMVRELAEADEQCRYPGQDHQMLLMPPEAPQRRQHAAVDVRQQPGRRALQRGEAVLRRVVLRFGRAACHREAKAPPSVALRALSLFSPLSQRTSRGGRLIRDATNKKQNNLRERGGSPSRRPHRSDQGVSERTVSWRGSRKGLARSRARALCSMLRRSDQSVRGWRVPGPAAGNKKEKKEIPLQGAPQVSHLPGPPARAHASPTQQPPEHHRCAPSSAARFELFQFGGTLTD